jgi:hypothetical protein
VCVWVPAQTCDGDEGDDDVVLPGCSADDALVRALPSDASACRSDAAGTTWWLTCCLSLFSPRRFAATPTFQPRTRVVPVALIRAHVLLAEGARDATRCWRPTPRMPPVSNVFCACPASSARTATATLAGARTARTTTRATRTTGLQRAWRRVLSRRRRTRICAATSHLSSPAPPPRAWMAARGARRRWRPTCCSLCVAFVRPPSPTTLP